MAIGIRPEYEDAYFNLGVLLKNARRHAESFATLQHSIALNPDHAEAQNCLGSLFIDAGRDQEAEEAFRKALVADPELAAASNNLGNLLMKVKRLKDAESSFRKAVSLQPGYGYARGQAVTCARRRYAWASFEEDCNSIYAALQSGEEGIPALMVLALPGASLELHRKSAILSARKALQPYLDRPPLVSPKEHRQHERLRIGYLSADFREHAVMHLLAGVLSHHDKRHFEIHAYSNGPAIKDEYRKRIEGVCEFFRDLRHMGHLDAARSIAEDEIDILVDLTGHTGDARPAVSAMRPAPLIVNWLGYPGTLGIPRLADYIIGDSVLTPVTFAEHYSETLAWMPHCYQPNDDALVVGLSPTRREAGLPDDALVFCSFNQSYKLTPETFSVWCRLLVEVEASVLWLLDPGDDESVDNLRKEACDRGVEPDRLVFAPNLPLKEHLARLPLADLALDSFPYGSGATGSNLLRAGVPLVTLLGEAYVSRMAASQLHGIGAPELITENWDEYFKLAKQLATEPMMRQTIRDKLIAVRDTCPLFDTQGFTRDLEALYSTIWDQHARGICAAITTSAVG
jgi:predicted O-linked N-acetylglucosamine transferase (SPINDLY family)